MKSIENAKQAAQRINGSEHEGRTLRAYAINGWLHVEKFLGTYGGAVASDEVSIPFSDVGPMRSGARGLDGSLGRTVWARCTEGK